MPFIIGILVLIAILQTISFLLEDLFYSSWPFFIFLKEKAFLLLGSTCVLLAIAVYVYLKPHPAQKHIEAYKKGKISRQIAIAKVATTFYNPRRDGIPSTANSKIMAHRITALHKRIKAERTFVDEVIAQIKRNAE